MLIRPVIYDPIRSVMRDPLGASIGFYVGQLFANGEQGVWYDPSDFSTLFQDAAGTIPVTAVEQPVGRILDKSGRGNHATQATAAARPVLSARKNLLTKTEQFDDAFWAKVNITIAANALLAPDGQMTGDLATITANGAAVGSIAGTFPATSTAVTYSIHVNPGTRATVEFLVRNNTTATNFTLGTFTAATGAVVGAGWTSTAVENGWFRLTFSQSTGISVGDDLELYWGAIGGVGTAGQTWGVWGAQLERGPTATRYQRVTTATDYDNYGFPHYLKFDGVDDFLVTGNIDFTVTDSVTLMAGITKTANTMGIVAELGTTGPVTTPGTFSLFANSVSNNFVYQQRGGGTNAQASSAAESQVSNVPYVITGRGDVSLDQSILRSNAVQQASSAADQGAGNFINAAIFIGRRAGTSIPLNGQLNQLIIRGASSTNTQIEYCEDYVASKTGVTLP